ncbi:unnamed protein product, partial [Laminaria digitata]
QALVAAKLRPPYPNCQDQLQHDKNKNKNLVSVVEGASIHAVPCENRHFQAVPAFYTNFEVARIEMFRSSWYQDWFNSVDKTGAIFYSRWGDAPLRFLGLAMHLPSEKILQVQGCRHS